MDDDAANLRMLGTYDSTPTFSAPQTRPVILALEDDEDNLLLLKYALEQFQCTLIHQSSGHEALKALEHQTPDLILADIVLPDIDGVEFLRRLKRQPKACDIPVIAVTAMARPEDRERLLNAGFSDYLSKPYMLDDLEVMIRQHLVCFLQV